MSITPTDMEISKEYLEISGLDFARIPNRNTPAKMLWSPKLPHLKLSIEHGKTWLLAFDRRVDKDTDTDGAKRYLMPADADAVSVVSYAYLLQIELHQLETRALLKRAVAFHRQHLGWMKPFSKGTPDEQKEPADATLPGPPEHRGEP